MQVPQACAAPPPTPLYALSAGTRLALCHVLLHILGLLLWRIPQLQVRACMAYRITIKVDLCKAQTEQQQGLLH